MDVVDQTVCGEMNDGVLGQFWAGGRSTIGSEVNRFELLGCGGEADDLVGLLPAEAQPGEVSQPRFRGRPFCITHRGAFSSCGRVVFARWPYPWIITIKDGFREHGPALVS